VIILQQQHEQMQIREFGGWPGPQLGEEENNEKENTKREDEFGKREFDFDQSEI